ncbi:MAG TPA: lysylphosphatidylglycerol synthase transmembrane domain-containing protein [Pyrinomonadaceae bacterium]|nr:lysylphosphatidylglycerol synthase transmembrane domain-containing protein [Pyrinomonadaceae bacterium]
MRRYLKFIVLTLVAAAVLWWFGRGLDWASVRAAIGRSDWRLIALAVVLVWTTYFLRALRWRALLAPITEASLRELFAATTIGFSTLFLIGRAGEAVARPAFLSLRDRRVRPAAAFVTIGLERIYDMTAVVVLFAVNLIWFRAPGGDVAAYARVRQAGMVLLVAVVVGIASLVWFKHHSRAFIGWLEARFERAPSFVRRAGGLLTHVLEQVASALSVLVDARELAVTVGLTALLWGIIAVANWLVLRAFGLPFGVTETLFVLGWALVGSLVPTPGGAAGAFHAATAAGLIFLGVARDEAAAISIVLHLVVFAPAVVFGLYYFLRSDVSFESLRSLAASDAGEDAQRDEAGARATKEKSRLSELSHESSAGAET